MSFLRILDHDLDDPLFLRLFDSLGLNSHQEVELIHVLKRITTPMETLIARGRSREALAFLEKRQQQRQQLQRQPPQPPQPLAEEQARLSPHTCAAAPFPGPGPGVSGTRHIAPVQAAGQEKAAVPPLPSSSSCFHLRDPTVPSLAALTATPALVQGHASRQDAPARRVLVTFSSGRCQAAGGKRFLYSSHRASRTGEDAFVEEVQEQVRQWRDSGGERGGSEGEETYSVSVNYSPSGALKKTVWKVTAGGGRKEGGKGGGGEGKNTDFDVLANVSLL
ncbi:hypothetical protein NSK_003975 [Nannochloropsis salina CCMP1776]|uniref:Uncharacterized protein n=1 Tax=Nannochloropsis salina CCMP1776 TaxID=1027361 RepID=A0A4D9D3J1_9STRA|nr:hypothetical protein NSK_003975 [Nannochloropsis salina CCMP1776]|eukprot:TFJ84947.1 hypothetical protein NSK_003975 [Nannochloropsis salina CCMP1776]